MGFEIRNPWALSTRPKFVFVKGGKKGGKKAKGKKGKKGKRGGGKKAGAAPAAIKDTKAKVDKIARKTRQAVAKAATPAAAKKAIKKGDKASKREVKKGVRRAAMVRYPCGHVGGGPALSFRQSACEARAESSR